MAGDLKGQLEFEVEAGGASAKIGGLKRDLASLGQVAKEAGEASALGMKQAADAGSSAAGKLDAATSSLVSRIKRAMAEVSNGMRSGLDSDLAERLGTVRGLNMSALKPWIDALRQIEGGYKAAVAEQAKLEAASKRAADAEKALAGIRSAADKAAKDAFYAQKREQEAIATERAERAEKALAGMRAVADKAARDSYIKEKREQEAAATERAERAERALAGLRSIADKAAKDSFYAPQREREAAATEAAARAQQALDASTRQLATSERELAGLRTSEQRLVAQDFLSAQRREQAEATRRLTEAQRELKAAMDAVNQAERSGASTTAAKARVDAMQQEVAAATAQAAAVQRAIAAGSSQIREADAYLGSLQRRLDIAAKTPYENLANQARSLGLKEGQFKPILDELARLEKGFTGVGKESRLAAQQMALVAPQITDIVTQLQMGTDPFTILIQQGGQLRDIFGSVGGALKGLGAGLLALLTNPVVLATAAVAGLATAYAKGAAQSAEFARTITLTGNAAGITEGQYNSMAKAIADATHTTIGSTRASLQSLAGSGQLSGEVLRSATTAVQLFSKVSGDSAEAVSKRFIAAADGPAKFAQELNKQYNFLTAAQVQQIKTMEDQGRTQEALKATFDALNTRLQDAAQHFGTLERWWDTLKRKGSEGIDFVLRIGRVQTTDEMLTGVREQINKATAQPFDASRFGGNAEARARLPELRAQEFGLSISADQEAQAADARAKRAQSEKDIAAAMELQGRYLDKNGQLTKALRDYASQVSRALMSPTITEADRNTLLSNYDKNIQEIRDRFKESPEKKPSQSGFNDANRAEVEAVKKAEAEKLGIIKQAQEAISLARATGVISERVAIEQNTQQELRALETRRDALLQEAAIVAKKKDSTGQAAQMQRQAVQLEEEITLRSIKGKNELIKLEYERAKAIQATLDAMRQEGLDEVDAARRRDEEARNAVEIGLIDRKQALKEEAQLLEQETGWIGQSNVQRRLGVELLRIHLNLQREIAKVQAMSGPNIDQDWRDQQIRALQDQAVRESAVAQRRVYVDEWQRTSEQVGQSLSDALMEGGKSAGEYIKGLFRSMVLRPIVQAIVQPIIGTAGAMASSLFGGGSGGGGGGSGIGGAINTASTLNSLYGMYTGAGIASAGSAIYGFGSAVGSSSIAAFGTGMQGATLGAGLAGPTTVGASGAMGAGATAGSALSSVASAIPYVAAVLAILNIFGAFRSKKVVGNGLVGTVGDEGDLDTYALIRKGGTLLSGPDYSIRTSDASPELTTAINNAVGQMLTQARAMADVVGQGGNLSRFTAPIGSELIHPEVGRYGISLAGLSEEDAKKKIEQEITKLVEKMAEQALGPAGMALQRTGETASQTLGRLSGSLKAVNQALDNFNDTLLATNLNSADAASKLADLFGGADQFNSVASSYFQRFYNDSERAAVATRQLSKAFAELGVGALPSTKDAYRQLVNAQDLTTESGRKTYAALLQLSGVFADLKDAVEQAGKSVRDEIDRLRGGGDARDQASLQAQFAIKTGQARAGDAEALAALPELTKALEEAAKNTASTAADVAVARAQLAASLSETLRVLKVPGFASGGLHAGGWRVVGEVGPELEYTPPSRIFNQSQAQSLVNTEKMESLLQQLIERLDAAQDQGLRADTSLIIQTKKVADTLQAVVYGGQSLATRAGD